MLTISRLAAHAGVTAATVRHYHKIGLLPEPGRDRSGYRRYDASDVVRLIRIHILASAGVPLAHVEDLLAADADSFTESVREIDTRLRAEIRRLHDARQRIARLSAGEHLALPQGVVDYLDRVRGLGVSERYIEKERDAWILVAAEVPHRIDSIIAKKHEDLNDPDMVRLYRLLSDASDWSADDPQVVEVADILDGLFTRAAEDGEVRGTDFDDRFADLLDTTMAESAPAAKRLLVLLEERGWRGWTRLHRIPEDGPVTD